MSAVKKGDRIRVLAVLGLLSALGFMSWSWRSPQRAEAQGVMSQQVSSVEPRIWPPHPPLPRPIPPVLNQELQLETQRAAVEINGTVARTHLTQVFRNTTSRRIEGTYVFPLPEGAAVSGFAMTVNGKRMQAEILEGAKAREIYTGIVRQLKDPAILEFIDRNLIQAKIFPIEPNAAQTMELEYSETLRADSGSFRYVVPLRLPTGGAAREASVDVRIQSPSGIKAIYSPTHDIDVRRDGKTARVSGEWKSDSTSVQPIARTNSPTPRGGSDRDFVLYLTTAGEKIGVNLITHNPAGEDGYFMMLVAPDNERTRQEFAGKDVVFVFDTSGSMSGEKIEQARKALLTLLGNLNPNDRFNVVTFSSDVRTFRDGLVKADGDMVKAARGWTNEIKAVGGTNINDALLEGLKMFKSSGRPQQLVFMTDGQPTVGETDVAQILKNVRAANTLPVGARYKSEVIENTPRLFVFGVGYDVNTRLLDTLAEDNRGSSDYVLPEEDIEQKVGSLYAKIAYPVLTNPRIEWNGMKVYDVYPKRLPDLFRGTQLTVFGRYEGKSPVRPQLIGLSLGREERIAGQGNFEGEGSLNDLLPRLWATRKVGYLVDEARRANRTVDPEVQEEIVKLSKKYGIVTPFTAGLITEDERPVPVLSDIPLTGSLGRRENQVGGDRRYGATGPSGPMGAPSTSGGFGGGGFGGGMMAADSGESAVRFAREKDAWQKADQVRSTEGVRHIDGKTFVLRGDVWTDAAYDAAKSAKPQTIKFGSDEYFALLKDAKVAKWLSLGESVLIVLDKRVIKIEP